ncbi:MAG: hypothetical protein IPJ41_02995 [Phycisphaerales bacterium]|nr:hypothetical protein [Phycisphaerales bacterium]
MATTLLNALHFVAAAGLVNLGVCLAPEPQTAPQPEHPAAPAQPGAVEVNPEDVGSVDGIMRALYESTAGPAGQARQWDRLRSICEPNVTRFLAARDMGEGHSTVMSLTVEDYIMHNKRYFERGGYWEKEIARRTETFGNITQVWSTYEARRGSEESAPYVRGIYSLQLLKDGDRWWLLSVLWQLEGPETPMPEKYLESPKE